MTPTPTKPTPKIPVKPYVGASAPAAAVAIGVRKPQPIVPRLVMYAGEKFGKTTLAAFAPDPIILMCRDTGYDTLLGAGTVPAVRAAECNEWGTLLDQVRAISDAPGSCKTLIIDGISGAERACHEHVCRESFKGDWGDAGFMGYHKGYELAVTEWLKLLSALDRVKEGGTTVVLLAHASTKAVRNPMGADYDRFEPSAHAKTWAATAKWADAICFGKFQTIVDVGRREASKKIAEQKGKAIGGTQRVLFTEPHDAWIAGNRYGMDSEIWISGGPETMWQQVMDQIRKPVTE